MPPYTQSKHKSSPHGQRQLHAAGSHALESYYLPMPSYCIRCMVMPQDLKFAEDSIHGIHCIKHGM